MNTDERRCVSKFPLNAADEMSLLPPRLVVACRSTKRFLNVFPPKKMDEFFSGILMNLGKYEMLKTCLKHRT